MKKIFILFLSLLILQTLYAGNPIKENKVQYSCEYTRAEDFSQEDFWLTKLCVITKKSIVNTPESAAMLTYVYVLDLYGEDIAKGEQPYQISLVNDSIWCINGSSKHYKKKKWKGNFIIAIDKKTGSLLAHMHEK